MSYYEKKGMEGYKFAYMYSGMNKVLQASGRVIRTESDSGVVFLIDSRFLTKDYLSLFPNHWRHYVKVTGEDDAKRRLEEFWGGVIERNEGIDE